MASTSVRTDGTPPTVRTVAGEALMPAVAAEVRSVRHRHHNTGIVAPEHLFPAIAEALATVGLRAAYRVQALDADEVPVFTAEGVKGLEFDYVVLLEVGRASYPTTDESRHLLHIAATRAAHQLWVTSTGEPSTLLPQSLRDRAY